MRKLAAVACLVAAIGCHALHAEDGFPTALDLESFEIVWRSINESYFDPEFGELDWKAIHDEYHARVLRADNSQDFYHLLNQMVFELERSHSAVIPPGSARMFLPRLYASGTIGLDVRWLGGKAIVTRVDRGSPADEAGIRPGFTIRSFDGVPVDEIVAEAMELVAPPFNDRSSEESVNSALLAKAYGEAGAEVSLSFEAKPGIPVTVELIHAARERVSTSKEGMPPVYLDFESRWLANEIGYISFNTFHADLLPDITEAVRLMSDARGLIVDLRGNPGGELDAMVEVAGHVLGEPAVLVTLVMRSQTIEVPAIPAADAFRGPLVLLTDVRCTSGSEMLSTSLQALGRAFVIGEHTPGSVTGANMIALPNGALLMYPFVQTLAADGSDPEGIGVVPDLTIPLCRDQLLDGLDAQVEAAVRYLLGVDGG